MENSFQVFEKIGPYLKHPLVLIGFLLLLFFGIHSKLISSGIIPKLDQDGGTGILHALLAYGFIVALVLIILGFALTFMKEKRKMPPST